MPKQAAEKLSPEMQDQLDYVSGSASSEAPAKVEPSYRMMGEAKIPVSKVHGKLWKQRYDLACKDMKEVCDAWDEAVQYYLLTQESNRTSTDGGTSGSNYARKRNNPMLTERENLVFANVAAMVPALYAKAPECAITCNTETYKDLARCVQELVNVLFYKKIVPGVNLKPKVRKAIVQALLTNEAWLEVGYTRKEDANEQVMADIAALAQELETATTTKKLKEVEGKLRALEAAADVALPSGPFVRLRRGKDIKIDKECENDDLSDANWIMIDDYLPTEFLNAKFAKKNKEGQWESVYEPTHILKGAGETQSLDDQVNNFRLFTTNDRDRKRSELEKRDEITQVVWIWDKTTKRVYLYATNNWAWPIWVYEDPYNLDRFFPIHRLAFHTSPVGVRSKGEVSYYLDQVDAIAEINDAEARARQWIKRAPIYNTAIITDQKEVDKILKGDDGTAVGVKLPDGAKLDDAFLQTIPDVIKLRPLFDETAIQRKLQSIDRISSTSDIQRGAQYKTNTTNKAIDAYNSIQNQRIDERIDAIEDVIGDVAWSLAQVCLQFMPADVVAPIVGPERAQFWTNMEPEDIHNIFNCRIEGGSTTKPTSRAKKQEAIEATQALGQFAQAAPGPTLKLILRVFSRAFDEFTLTDEDWVELDQAIFAAQQSANATGSVPGQEGSAGADPAMQQELAKLPPEAQQAVQIAVQKGVPLPEAIKGVMAELQSNQPQQ